MRIRTERDFVDHIVRLNCNNNFVHKTVVFADCFVCLLYKKSPSTSVKHHITSIVCNKKSYYNSQDIYNGLVTVAIEH